MLHHAKNAGPGRDERPRRSSLHEILGHAPRRPSDDGPARSTTEPAQLSTLRTATDLRDGILQDHDQGISATRCCCHVRLHEMLVGSTVSSDGHGVPVVVLADGHVVRVKVACCHCWPFCVGLRAMETSLNPTKSRLRRPSVQSAASRARIPRTTAPRLPCTKN